MKIIKNKSNLLKSLTTDEKMKIRRAVEQELERYRTLKHHVDHLDCDQDRFCRRIEQSIEGLPSIEKFVITTRYTEQESQYRKDYQVYNELMNPPVSAVTFNVLRNNAFIKIALFLGLDTGVDIVI